MEHKLQCVCGYKMATAAAENPFIFMKLQAASSLTQLASRARTSLRLACSH